ncbi:MAG: SDR family NAD(P)-dependent oxidoreductase [Deltaproteobacteria bacterium]|nr:SDR family NAD(P)-dependent oxidoreductase [Deltaproteobacteria bacterium]MBW2393698.1 SDR family NAD(P)-dependent oxidoreductase [Deltaproteobacteria bacterium]
MSETAIVLGVGAEKGLGATLCRRFAKSGHHVVIGGRTPEKIERVADGIRGLGGAATAFQTDATSESAVIELFQKAEAIGPVDLAIYNAGNNMPGDLLTMEAEFFELCWRIACFGGFLFGREAARVMKPRGKGTLLFTGASASLRGKPFFSAFTAAKGGLRNFAQSMAREFGPQGIHVGHVIVDGGIAGDRIEKGRPEFAEARGSDGLVDLEGIADIYDLLYHQPRAAWSHEIDVRTHKEAF